jgi:signal transduction histidine kinase
MQNVIATNKALLEKSQQLQDALNHEYEMRKMQNEFIALVSHEFKTPLQIIDSTRENVVRKIKNLNINDESINKGLDRIRSGVWRMNGLINTTLNLAKMENSEAKLKVNLTSLNLSKLLEDNIDKSKNLAQGRNIEIISNIANNIPEIKSDPMLIEHIFTNLISNAIKYSPNNSKVKVSAEIIENNNIEIKVQDYGIGIPSNEIDKIGSKFFRASNSIAQAGTGIGIYLTKNFIELLGGKFSLTSKENTGTLVKVILPINP